jgi:hypothetical protein
MTAFAARVARFPMASERAERLAEALERVRGLHYHSPDLIPCKGECDAAVIAAELDASRARERALTEALRAEARKRFHYTDGSQPDVEWIDAKLAEMYPALARGDAPEAQA